MKNNRFFTLAISLLISLLLTTFFIKIVFSVTGIFGWQAIFDLLKLPFSSATKLFDVIASWMPLLLAVAALLFAFRAGFWNIGVEGQIIIGAVFATSVIRGLQFSPIPPVLVAGLGLIFGAIGGGLWGFIGAYLKTESGIHEIVSGIALNVLALGVSTWLVLSPWRRIGVGSGVGTVGGTDMISQLVWFPQIGRLRVSILTIIFAVTVFVGVSILLNRSRLGLQLSAFQFNPRAKYIHSAFTSNYIWRTFALSGMMAGFTGAVLVLGTFHRLIPSVSAGMGLVAILIVLMVYQDSILAAIVAFVYSMANINSVSLSMNYQIHPSVVGVFIAAWTVLMLISYQIINRFIFNRD